MEKENRNIRSEFTRIAIAFLCFIMFVNLASSQSMPLSVHGTVYELDGVTQVPAGTSISINDTTSGYYVEGITGTFYNSGKYSASIQGDNGDEIIITASSGYNSVSVVVTLEGSMREVNLFLNTSIPQADNQAPKIVSQPLMETWTGVFYRYDVDATDEDGDELIYSLTESPSRMTINPSTGVIEWLPGFRDVGRKKVIVKVEDGRGGEDTQEFYIKVKLRIRNINMTDTYTQLLKNTSLEEKRYLIITNASGSYTVYNGETAIRELSIGHKDIYLLLAEYNKKPSEIKDTFGNVYKYIQLYPLNSEGGSINNVSLLFKVEKRWINEKRIKKEDVGLARFSSGKWYYVAPGIVHEDEGNVYYLANANGLDNFAIFAGQFSEWNDFENLQGLPYFVVGTIYEKDGITHAGRGTKVEIKNEATGEEINLETGIGPMDGAYASFIPGNEGDKIIVEVDDNPKSLYSFRLRQQGNELNFKKNNLGNYKAKKQNILIAKMSRIISMLYT